MTDKQLPKPGDKVRIRLDYVGEVDEDGDVRVPENMALGFGGAYIPVTQPDDLSDFLTIEVITPPMEEPTRLGTVVVDADGDRAVCVGRDKWQIIGAAGGSRWDDLTQPVRLATEEERG